MKGEYPPQSADQQPKIARVADKTIDAGHHKRVPRLDGDEPAEPVAEHKDRQEPQRASGRKKKHADPADTIAVECPERNPVRVSRQISSKQSDYRKGRNDPAIGTILANPGTQISARKDRSACQGKECYRKGGERLMKKEGSKPAFADDGKAEICGSTHGDEGQPENCRCHSLLPPSRMSSQSCRAARAPRNPSRLN